MNATWCKARFPYGPARRFAAMLAFAVAALAGVAGPAAAADNWPVAGVPSSIVVESAHERSARKRIEKALESIADFEFSGTPLSEVLDQLAREHGIPIVLDRRALDDEGIAADVPVELRVRGISLESGLNLILDPHDLCLAVRNEVLMVTTTKEAEDLLITRVYPVGDLVLPSECATLPDEYCEPDFDALIELIMTTVDPTYWDEAFSLISSSESATAMVVLQAHSAHRQIESLLAALRRVREHTQDTAAEFAESDRQRAARERIENALASPAEFEFSGVPLSDVLDQLADEYGVPIVVDRRALDDEGISADVPVDLHARGLSLESGLNLILEPHDLCFTVRNEVLLVTTTKGEDYHLTIRVYPVGDLVQWWHPDAVESGTGQPDLDELIDVITMTVSPTSWDEVGGPGSIKEWEPTAALVIAQTLHVHCEVESTLAALRRARDLPTAPPRAATERGESKSIQ